VKPFFLGHIGSIIRLCAKRPLEATDLKPSYWFRSTEELEIEALNSFHFGDSSWTLLKTQILPLKSFVILGLGFSSMQGILGTVGRYLILRTIIRAVRNNARNETLVMLAILFFLVALFEGICSVAARQLLAGNMTQALIARHSALLMNKVSKLAVITKDNDIPKSSTLYGADIPRLLGFVRYLSLLACGFTSIIGGLIIVGVFLGFSALVALVSMILIGSFQQYFTHVAKKIEPQVTSKRDDVLASISRAIRASKALKFFAWESQFASRIHDLRNKHASKIIAYRLRIMLSVSMGKAFPIVATVCTLLTTALQHNGQVQAEDAFAVIAVFQTVRVGMIILPIAMVLINTYILIHVRIAKFLGAEEDVLLQDTTSRSESKTQQEYLVHLMNALWRIDDFSLTIPNLKIARGKFICVVGSVGTGKTQLIKLLLGRTTSKNITSSIMHVDASLGYAPQDPFVASGTIEENILFGRPKSEAKLIKAIRIACLDHDIDSMPQGLATLLGERGTTLSGGQMARLQVARAIYNDPNLLLLDASLAAVDAKVGRMIFQNLRSWIAQQHSSVLLVLSQISLVPECDECILMENGRLIAQAPAQELIEILKSREKKHVDTDEDDFPAHLYATLKQYYDKNIGDLSAEDLPLENDVDSEYNNDQIIIVSTADEQPNSSNMKEEQSQKNHLSWRAPRGFIFSQRSHKRVPEDLIKAERLQRGAISKQVFWQWAKGVGYGRILFIIGLYLLAGFVLFASDIILAQWTKAKTGYYKYMIAYAVVALTHLPCLVIGGILGVFAAERGGSKFHHELVWAVLRAPISFFESTPSGRIISRFGSDFDTLDLELGQMLDGWLTMVSLFAVLLIAMCIVTPLLFPLIAFCCYGMVQFLWKINEANRDIKRIANSCVAPVVTNSLEAEKGRIVAEAHNASDFFILRMRERLDAQLSAFYASISIMQAAYLNATIWSALISLAAALIVVVIPAKYTLLRNSAAPVALSYAIVSPYFAAMASEILLTLSLYAISLERVYEYLPSGGGLVPAEPAHSLPSDTSILASRWPQAGHLVFDNVGLRYRPSLPLALSSVSFSLDPGCQAGIVGRTGAGKSTILVCLFRLVDICQGSISIDGIDISSLGLTALRKRLTLIPQEAVLMKGSAKFNCDPFGEYNDKTVADALEVVGLSRNLLHQDVVDQDGDGDDSSLSTGQAQLLALCRAILRKSKVCCFDEATAHIDSNTDANIQRVIAREFKDSTLLTIAHRIHTIIKYDKVIVMEDGHVAAFDEPFKLLQDNESSFYSICAALGPAALTQLTELAETASRERHHDTTTR